MAVMMMHLSAGIWDVPQDLHMVVTKINWQILQLIFSLSKNMILMYENYKITGALWNRHHAIVFKLMKLSRFLSCNFDPSPAQVYCWNDQTWL